MLAMPFLMVGTVGFFLWRASKKAGTAAEAAAGPAPPPPDSPGE